MAITNVEIILQESLKLMEQGILKPSGRMLVRVMPDGSETEIPEPEPIHTYNGWKELGYHVKRGEHAKAAFPIWKYKTSKNGKNGKNSDPDEDDKEKGYCFAKNSFWFTSDQVEKIG